MLKYYFDDKGFIDSNLKSLDDLHEIVRLRREMLEGHKAKDEPSRLREFLVLGKYYLDTFGQLSFVTDAPDFFNKLDKVETYKSVREKIKYHDSIMKPEYPTIFSYGWGGHSTYLPKSSDICPVCNKGWDLSNSSDVLLRDKQPYHKRCYVVLGTHEDVVKFTKLFEEAGFAYFSFSKLENGYHLWEGSLPWWKVMTIYGDITIGWRKRVINIDWADLEHPIGEELFKEEDVTKDSSFIHAWSWEKAGKYLKMLRESL